MKVHDLQPAPGSRKRAKRVARGIGGKGAKTAGRGMKGQRARSTVRESCGLDEVSPEALHAKGLVGKKSLVKVLGRGVLTRAVTVRAHAFSASAEAAIAAAGGSIEKLPLPFAVRPPASGNALMNR